MAWHLKKILLLCKTAHNVIPAEKGITQVYNEFENLSTAIQNTHY